MKKVIIFYASYGGGHLAAANSLKDCILENYPNIKVEIVDCIKYINKALDKVTTSAYKEMAKKAPWAWGHVYYRSQTGALSQISTVSNKILSHKLEKLFEEEQPDLVISTHPFGTQMTSYLKKKGHTNCKLANVLTDFAPHEQWLVGCEYVDYFFVSHLGMKKELTQLGIDPNKIFATGIPISLRFMKTYDRELTCKEFGLNPNKRTILFFGGGEYGLGKHKTLDIFQALVDNCKNFQLVAIAGKNKKMKDKFDEIANESENKDSILVLEYTTKVPELMNIAYLVITKPGGLTTTESLACRLPIVIINPIPGQEEENARYLSASKAAIWIKKHDNPIDIINNLLNDEKAISDMKRRASILSKRKTTQNICNILFDQ